MSELRILGAYALGDCVPALATVRGALDAVVAAQLPELEARLAGALVAQAQVAISPPTIAGQIEAALAVVASLQASVGGVSVDVAAMAAAVAELEATIGGLQASLSASLALGTMLGAGVWLLHYQGRPGDLVPGGLPGVSPETQVEGVVVLGADAGAIEAIRAVLRAS